MEKYKKKFSIGLSLDITLEEYKILLSEYREYINSIYFSPPLGDVYHTRSKISERFHDLNSEKHFYEILKLFKENDIELDCVLNRLKLKESDVVMALKFLKENIDVDQITCLDSGIDLVDSYFPDVEKIYSFNNDLTPGKLENISKKYDTIVVGKYFLRDYSLLKKVIDNGFNIKLLLNNGCSFNCGGCSSGNGQCTTTFMKNLAHSSIDEIYALQSFYPFELDELLSILDIPIKSLKISNRTSNFKYLYNCLTSYVNVEDTSKYIQEDYKNYRLWARLGPLADYLKYVNEENVIKEKIKLLEKSKKCI